MNKKWASLWNKIKTPPLVWRSVLYISTVIVIGITLFTLFIEIKEEWLSILSYVLYALSAILLTYSVFLIVTTIPHVKQIIVKKLESREFTRSLLKNYGFRTIIFAIGSFVMSIAFGAFNAYMGIKYLSIWYGALATYYISLAFLRGGVLLYHGRNRKSVRFKSENQGAIQSAKNYRNSGITLLVLNIALSSAIAQMIFDNRFFSFEGWTIYAFAAYAFYKITMSTINILRASKQQNLTVKAIRNVNLMDAMVSILALQTALLATFMTEGTNVSLFNTLTGSVVSLLSISIGIFMIIKANKIINNIRMEKKENGKKSI